MSVSFLYGENPRNSLSINELGGSDGAIRLTPYRSVSYSVFPLSVSRSSVKQKRNSFFLYKQKSSLSGADHRG
jgi:hypothetical protein